jgi:hypothetical protein
MPHSAKADERTTRIQIAALAALGLALLVAAALGTYQASLAKAHAVRDAVPEGAPSAVQYLPGSSAQIGTLREPLMTARRAALRAGFDAEDAPIDAFDNLRTIPGHDDEARSLLAQYWDRRAMLAENPLYRALYALQARVVDDDEGLHRTAESAVVALGPLRGARHVGDGTVVSCDPQAIVLRGERWLRVLNRETGAAFDVPESDAGSALVAARRMVTWTGDTARSWDLDEAAPSPGESLKLLPGETPLSFAGACALTSAGRVWRVGDGTTPIADTPGHWFAGSINPACDRVVLRSKATASYRRHGKSWTGGIVKVPGKGVKIDVCAAQAPVCVVKDPTHAPSIWSFAAPAPRRLYEGIDCEPKAFSPDGTQLMCDESPEGVTVYSEDDAGAWTRTDLVLPGLNGSFLQDDGTICGSVTRRDRSAVDRSDVLFLEAKPCGPPATVSGARASIQMLSTGTGAVFTYPPTIRSAAYSAEFFGFDSKGESLAAASNAWFGDRNDERLVEHDATNSAGQKTYDLAGEPFDPALALGDRDKVSPVRIDQAFFAESPEPSLLLQISASDGAEEGPTHVVARWNLRQKHFCGAPVPGAITSIAPTGDALVIDGRIYKIGVCASDHGFDPTEVTGVLAVGPGATRWIAREGDTMALQVPQRAPTVVPAEDRTVVPQIAFSPNGAQFLVRTAKSLCNWEIRDDGTLDLDACRWSIGGWASDAAWAASDKSGETAVVFDRTAGGVALRELFGSHDGEVPRPAGDLACDAPSQPNASPLAVLREWEERLGHRFKAQATTEQEARQMASPAIVPTGVPSR